MDIYRVKSPPKQKGVFYRRDKKFRGEIIIERRNNIDFSMELGHISQWILSKIPKNENYEERIRHYNLKTKKAFERLDK